LNRDAQDIFRLLSGEHEVRPYGNRSFQNIGNIMIAQARDTRFDVLRLPLVGTFLRWRFSRFVLQIPLLLLALLAVFDGFTGRQIAPVNVATVSVWVHYRGLVALAIAIVGNLFCAACPLMLTRGPSKFLSRFIPKLEFPKGLRNKYLVLALTFVFLCCYELFDLWASPYLTAWLIIGYFAAALIVDTLFPAGTFCKYVCPLGNFNFALAGASPTQITAINPSVCSSCEGKYCLNGRLETETTRAPLFGNRSQHVMLELPMAGKSRGSFPGCETDLFVPTINSNTDCTLCLNCVRACPYDNVALEVRSPIREAIDIKPKADWALFMTVLTWAGLVNAFAMIPTFYSFATSLSSLLGTRSEAVLLLVIQGFGVGAGVGLSSLAASTRAFCCQCALEFGAGIIYFILLQAMQRSCQTL
jgi:polyferredoxin